MRVHDVVRGAVVVLTVVVTVAVALTGCGGGGGGGFVPSVPPDSFAYATDGAAGNVRGYLVGGAGTLTEVPGSPFVTGLAAGQQGVLPQPVAADPGGRFLYVAIRSATNQLLTFRIDNATGALSPVGSPVATPFDPVGLAVDRQGRFLYLVTRDQTQEILTYPIDSATGAVGSPVSTNIPISPSQQNVQGPAIDPSGRFLYVTTSGPNRVEALAIDSATGVPVPVGGLDLPGSFQTNSPLAITVESTGKFAYIAYQASPSSASQILGFGIDGTTGALTPLAGSPFPAAGLFGFLKAHPRIGVLYSVDSVGNGVAVNAIDPTTGALTTVAGPPLRLTPPFSASNGAIDPSGSFLLATAGTAAQIASIDPLTGALTLLPGPVAGGMGLGEATFAGQ